MNISGGNGILDINGVEVRYMAPDDLFIEEELKYVDVFGLVPFIANLAYDRDTKTWDPPNVLLNGPTGTGKSLFFAHFSQAYKMPYLSLDCSEGTRDRHLKGGYTVNSQGSTPFILGTVANAVQVANEYGLAMLVFEELNALSPQLQKDVNALTDFRKKIEVPELSYRFSLLPGKRLFIGATMNPAVYGGTYELNRDLKNRFIEVDVPYPPPDQEKKLLRAMAPALPEDTLNRLVDIAQHTRQEATAYSLSPRDLVQVISMIPRVGWTDALFLAAQKFSDADRTLIIDRIKDITKTSIYPDLTERMKVLNIGGSTA